MTSRNQSVTLAMVRVLSLAGVWVLIRSWRVGDHATAQEDNAAGLRMIWEEYTGRGGSAIYTLVATFGYNESTRNTIKEQRLEALEKQVQDKITRDSIFERRVKDSLKIP